MPLESKLKLIYKLNNNNTTAVDFNLLYFNTKCFSANSAKWRKEEFWAESSSSNSSSTTGHRLNNFERKQLLASICICGESYL
jgi:hypothetical protein